MYLPDFLEPYRSAAVRLLGFVGSMEFSGETYQIEVKDPDLEESAFAFLQLDESGTFKDGFCSCEQSEDVSRCPHLATAFLRIYNDTTETLNKRFQDSLWNRLAKLFSHKYGYDTDLLTRKASTYTMNDHFTVRAKGKEAAAILDGLIADRRMETEESSLKFSNLSLDEIRLWREGRPSADLKYELSFWNDLAKWMMLMQDSGCEESIQFIGGEGEIPEGIEIEIGGVSATFKLDEQDIEEIIPSLATVHSSLKVHMSSYDSINRLDYNPESQSLVVKRDQIRQVDRAKGINIGSWLFVPNDGFYEAAGLHDPEKRELKGQDIARLLDQMNPAILAKLKLPVDSEPRRLRYECRLDEHWNLLISPYLVNKGDLSGGRAAVFGDWIYHPAFGFIKTESLRFGALTVFVKEEDVGSFITRHRGWFDNQAGFATHLAPIEGQLTYTLSREGALVFSGHFDEDSHISESHDFGSWVYIARHGFYSKAGSLSDMAVKPGTALDAAGVAPFIRMNRDELQHVPGFFSERCPVKDSVLHVQLTGDEQIGIRPEYTFTEGYASDQVRFFEDFVFVLNEGFHQLPAHLQLPYREEVTLNDSDAALFLAHELPGLERRCTVIVDKKLRVPETLTLTLSRVAPDPGGYKLKLAYRSDKGVVGVPEVWDAIGGKRRFLYHEAGLIDLYHKRFHWIRRLPERDIDRRSDSVRLSPLDFMRLMAQDSVVAEGRDATRFLEGLLTFASPTEPDFSALKSPLRPYQEIGLKWLWFLYSYGLSGLLCDDMGLGKTHQSMALLAAIKAERSDARFIIICPTSVIYHWEDKLADYLPNMRVSFYYGPGRSIEPCDIVLTSYGIWRMDHKKFKGIRFEAAVFDEVQMAKNESSRLHSALLQLQARCRFGLTGTPIENNLSELKALFDLVLPNYMPGHTEFVETFVKPIEKEQNAERIELLQKFVKPFVLRRKKKEVLQDLPEKTEEVYHCGLSPQQERLYREIIERSRREIIDEFGHVSGHVSYVHIFAILSSLKQVCDHPAVYLKKPESYKEWRSGKWELFIELLHEARDSRQKVVVYSQYLAMLDIIESYLAESGIGYASIRGATRNRKEELKRFNKDPNCEVFVGSLQAAGLGVDLTAASVVIHYDRWWNAARENQATDRVHRIGQERGVQVFKLVTKGTFEERIDQLIQSKGALMEDVVGADDQHLIKSLNPHEIMALLDLNLQQD